MSNNAQLPQREGIYKQLLAASPDPIVIYDMDGHAIYINHAFEETFGWSSDELLGKRIDFVPEQHKEETAQAIKQLHDGNGNVHAMDTKRYTKDGRLITIQLSASLFTDENKNPSGLIVILRDQESKESETKLRQLFERSADAILMLDKHVFIDCNLAAVRMMRAEDKTSLLSLHPYDLSPPTQPDGRNSDEKEREMLQIAHEKGTHQFEWVHRRMNGEDFPVNVTLTIVKMGGKDMVYAVLRDITEQKEATNSLRQSEAEARLFQEKLQALQNISMELSNLNTLEKLYEQAVMMGRSRLGFDRFRVLLHDPQNEEYIGTTGTDENGNIVDESGIRGEITEGMQLILDGDKRPLLFDPCDLNYADKIVGHGWAMLSGIWNHDDLLGWLAADNLITQEPVAPYQLELLSLYGLSLGNEIAKKRAEQELQLSLDRRGQMMRMATAVAQEIVTSHTLKELYDRVVVLVKETFNFYHVHLFIYDAVRERVKLVSSYGDVGQKLIAEGYEILSGVGLVGTAVAAQQSILRSDISNDPVWQAVPHLPEVKGELASPIILRGKILGVLDVQSDTVNTLSSDDELIIEGLCGQIAIATGNINLIHETERQLAELNALQQERSREGWEQQAEKDGLIGYQYDHTGLQPFTLSEPIGTADAAATTTDTALSPSSITTELSIRGQQFGILGIEEDPDQPLTDEERELFHQISEQISEALEAARLFEQTQNSLAVQERLSSELGTVAEVSTAASTILETDKLLQVVTDLAKASFNLYHAHIYLMDENKQKLVLQAGSGAVGRLMVLEGREININARSIVAQVARQKSAVIENNVHDTDNFLPHPLLPNTQSEMAVPLIVGENLIGVFDLQSDQVDYFTEDDVKIQHTLSSQIAVSVQNSRLYAEQVATAKKLRQVDQLKSEFLASMSHELRTPLNSIIGFSDILLEGLDGDLNERMDEDIRLIRGSGIHLRDLISEILDMSKIEAGRMDLRYENLDVAALIHDIIATAKPLSEERSLYLDLYISPDIGHIEADRMRFRQILYNIVSNAIKFTKKGGVMVDVRMQNDDFLIISVQDTGIGIKTEDLPVVFEQFRQIDGTLNRIAGGTGLGMPITKNLVELHGGEIWVDSTYGFGSTFFFTIPRRRPRQKSEAKT